jgi:hypothetical protein
MGRKKEQFNPKVTIRFVPFKSKVERSMPMICSAMYLFFAIPTSF